MDERAKFFYDSDVCIFEHGKSLLVGRDFFSGIEDNETDLRGQRDRRGPRVYAEDQHEPPNITTMADMQDKMKGEDDSDLSAHI